MEARRGSYGRQEEIEIKSLDVNTHMDEKFTYG